MVGLSNRTWSIPSITPTTATTIAEVRAASIGVPGTVAVAAVAGTEGDHQAQAQVGRIMVIAITNGITKSVALLITSPKDYQAHMNCTNTTLDKLVQAAKEAQVEDENKVKVKDGGAP